MIEEMYSEIKEHQTAEEVVSQYWEEWSQISSLCLWTGLFLLLNCLIHRHHVSSASTEDIRTIVQKKICYFRGGKTIMWYSKLGNLIPNQQRMLLPGTGKPLTRTLVVAVTRI